VGAEGRALAAVIFWGNIHRRLPLACVRFERRMFHSTFATEDQKEGMAAFIEKREPAFKGR